MDTFYMVHGQKPALQSSLQSNRFAKVSARTLLTVQIKILGLNTSVFSPNAQCKRIKRLC